MPAILFAAVVSFVLPIVYLVLWFKMLGRGGGGTYGAAWLVAVGTGATMWLTSMVLSIRAIVLARRSQQSSAGPVVALVLTILGALTGPASVLFGLLLAGGSAHGRPLRVRGRPRTASTTNNDRWIEHDLVPDLDGLESEQRAAHATRWTRDAQAEHASIAAFARLSLDLLALGAPPDLVDRTHHAALEESRHARLTFALASAYAGVAIGPTQWPAALRGAGQENIRAARRRVLLESILDGLYGEALAAERARCELDTCREASVRKVLAVIAEDEARHADLAMEVVSWLWDRVDAVAREDAGRLAEAIVSRAADDLEFAVASGVVDRLARLENDAMSCDVRAAA